MSPIDYKKVNIVLGLMIVASIVFVLPQWRPRLTSVSVYEEVHIDSPMQGLEDIHASLNMDTAMPSSGLSNSAKSNLNWQLPKEWSQEEGQGMRVVSFRNKSNPDEIDCSIVSLGAQAGGIKENLLRWAGQIKVELSEAELEKFIQSKSIWKTNQGREVHVFDFSGLPKTSFDTPTMIASIITTENSTVFVKMTGVKDAVLRNKKYFQELNESLSFIE